MRRNRLLLLLALLMTAATGAWGMQIYISYPSWPTGTNVNGDGNLVLEMEASDSFENMKAKIEDKSGLNPDYMKLYFNSVEMANNETLNAKGVTSNSVLTLVYTLYNVTMADGTKDAAKWTATVGTNSTAQPLPVGGLSKGDAVTLTYGGRLKVKNVTATTDAKPVWDGDLSKLTAESTAEFATATDGTTITGTLAAKVKVSIAAGATVTLDGVTINGVSTGSYKWAGLNCLGNATIVLKDGTTNTVKGFHEDYPGIHVPAGSKLTIKCGTEGTGKLTASPFDGGTDDSYGAGIGGGYEISCGDIDIQGGDITATGGSTAAGIGGGKATTCGNISIEGGTVTATGGYKAAGIGGGNGGTCGDITIASTVTKVTATKGKNAPYSIGKDNGGTCGTVTIGGTVYWQDNAAVSDGATYLAQATTEYPAAPTGNIVDLSTLTADYEAQNGDVLTGVTTSYKVTIAAGATVTLDGLTISGSKYCIKCLGDATIILKDGSTNTLTGTGDSFPALSIGDANTTLTIQGSTGVLNVESGDYCAGIGGGYSNTNSTCGNIRIEGGVITAQGGAEAAGIGSDSGPATCGDIIITGGTITAKGGTEAAGIGSGSDFGYEAVCGNITIANTVTKVTATAGANAPYSIGKGSGGQASCGTVTIGGTKYWENNAAVNGGDTYLATSPLIYEPSN